MIPLRDQPAEKRPKGYLDLRRGIHYLRPQQVTKYTKIHPWLERDLRTATTRKQRTLVLAQIRAHRRLNKYAAVVRKYGPAEGVSMEWKESKHTKAWRLVREATKLVKKLRRIQ